MSEEYVAPPAGNAEPPAPATPEVVINPIPTPAEPTEPATPKTFTQEDVDRIVAKRLSKAERNWERRNQQIIDTVINKAQPAQQPAPQAAAEEPDPVKYENYTDYLRDLTRYEANRVVAKTSEQTAQQRQEQAARQRAQEVQTNLRTKMEAASDKYEDFDEVVMDSNLPISPGMAEVIAESDVGGELAYYLGKNRNEAARIAAMSPLAAAKELGRIEAKLSNAAAAPQVSNAPPPPTPVNQRSTATKDPDKMSVEEWTAWRNAEIKKRRSA